MAKRIFLALFFIVSALILVSCEDVNPTDLEVLVQAAESMEIELEVTDNFELPVTFENEDISVSWTSDNSAIFIVSGNQAVVTRSSEDVSVKLTAVFTLGETVHEVDVNVVVKAVESEGSVTVEFTVTLPVGTPVDEDIVIAGNFGSGSNMPEWAPGDPVGVARRIDATTAAFTLVYDNVTEPITIQYKWTRGSWETVEKDINGDEIGDRTEVITADFETVTIDNVVERWADFNPDLTDEEKLALAKEALTVPSDVLADFVLPLSFDHGSTISWASSDSAIAINGSDAVVTSLESDIRVILTATISIGSLTVTKDFEVTVKSSDTVEFDTFELTINVELPSNTPMADDIFIFGNFPENTGLDAWGGADNPLNKFTRDGNTASITINFTELTDNITLEYKITRGNWDKVEGNETAGQSANREYVITRLLETHEIEITVLTWEDLGVPAQTDEEKIEQALQALVIQPEAIEDFTLPLSGLNETTISWASNDAAITIDGTNATLNRGETDITVELTATITLGELTDTHVFEVVVKALGVVYFETVELTITVSLPENTPIDDDVYIFGNFPENTGLDAWGGAENPLNTFTRDGNTAILKVTFTELIEDLDIEFKITRGDWTRVEGNASAEFLPNRTFTVTRTSEMISLELDVLSWEDLGLPQSNAEKLLAASDALSLPTDVLEDFTLPLSGLNETTISWASNDAAITIDGANATLNRGETDISVELTATITLGELTDTHVFEVVVKALGVVYFETFDLTITVLLPEYTPLEAEIFVFGNFPENTGLTAWGSGDNTPNKLSRDGNIATITINFTELSDTFNLEYKITRGTWDSEEVTISGGNVSNRQFEINRLFESSAIEVTVDRWKDITPPLTDEQKLDQAMNDLTILEDVSEDFTLPLLGLHDAVITWVSDNPVIAIDGENATITEDDIEILVILTATITVNGISDIKAFEVSVSSVSQVVYENVTVVMNVTLPVNTPVDATISVGGFFGELSGIPNWNPESTLGVATKDGNSATFTIQYNGLQSNQSIDYKWTRGSWDTVEKGATGEEISNRNISIDRLTEVITVNDVVLNWADLSVDETPPTVVGNLTIIEDFAMPGYGEDIFRTIRIWTPENYDPEGVTTYPVIYMQDGQNLFDAKTSFAGEWEIDETITGLMDMSLFAGAIVVGIDNSGANRLNEYTPNWSDTPEAGGALYAAFIVDTLKPYIDANYLTKPEREYTMVAGSSMGGLISFYIGLEYPEVFGMVGAFSTSFQMNTDVARQAFIDALDTENLLPRIIIDAGSEESLETFVPIVVEELADAGYPMIHVFSEVVAGHGHNEAAWRERFGDALVWLFSNEPGNYALVVE